MDVCFTHSNLRDQYKVTNSDCSRNYQRKRNKSDSIIVTAQEIVIVATAFCQQNIVGVNFKQANRWHHDFVPVLPSLLLWVYVPLASPLPGSLWANMTSSAKPEVHMAHYLSSEDKRVTATGNTYRKFRDEVLTCSLGAKRQRDQGRTLVEAHEERRSGGRA